MWKNNHLMLTYSLRRPNRQAEADISAVHELQQLHLIKNSLYLWTANFNLCFTSVCISPPECVIKVAHMGWPLCCWPFFLFQLTNLTEIHDQISGMARCPYNPLHNSTALITSSGELYAATAMDFSGRDPAIYRSLGGLPPLRTAQYNSKWLNGN